MRILLFAFASIGLAQASCSPVQKMDPFEAAKIHADDLEKQAKESQAALQREIAGHVAKVQDPLVAFAKEKGRPCGSKNLAAAAREANILLSSMGPKSVGAWGFQGLNAFGSVVLDVADDARKAGCSRIAEPLYEGILKTFIGNDYASLRQRSQIGLTSPQMARR